MNSRAIRFALLAAAIGIAAMGPAFAQEFPWEPATPPVYSPPVSPPPPSLPKVEPQTHIVPGHQSGYGYVAPYESDGPITPPLGPGGVSRGWVPGHPQ